MPILDILGSLDDLNMPPSQSVIDVDDAYPNSELLVSDDIWKKFELDFPELSGIEDIFDEFDCKQNSLFSLFDTEDCVLRNHDCMWAGHCASKEHPVDEPRHHSLSCIIPKPPVLSKTTVDMKPSSANPQSVLKPAVRAAASATSSTTSVMQHTPQTPPESDDEENKIKTSNLLKILNEAISEYDIDEDSDLCDYFEEGNGDGKEVELKVEAVDIKEEPLLNVKDELEDDEEVPEVKYKVRSFTQLAAENDHSYYKDKNASMMRNTNFGLDTPSDSEEEEIDVVSVNDKLTNSSRMDFALPTNPSVRDRQHLQRRMATAITKKRMRNGIKTILPVRKNSLPEPVSVKRKTEARGVKRSRGYRSSPYKKRTGYGNSCSDSEPEPSEKRSLHNNMERQRRIDLRNAFEDLRVLVPEVSKKDRAAKVVILREASKYCTYLGSVSNNYTRQLEDLKKQQEWLRLRVSQLRRNLAAKR